MLLLTMAPSHINTSVVGSTGATHPSRPYWPIGHPSLALKGPLTIMSNEVMHLHYPLVQSSCVLNVHWGAKTDPNTSAESYKAWHECAKLIRERDGEKIGAWSSEIDGFLNFVRKFPSPSFAPSLMGIHGSHLYFAASSPSSSHKHTPISSQTMLKTAPSNCGRFPDSWPVKAMI